MRLSRPFRFNYELISRQDHSAGRNKKEKRKGRQAGGRLRGRDKGEEEEQQLETSPEASSLPAGGRRTSPLKALREIRRK